MNTFLPFADYEECAKVIDPRRINSQINETLILIRSLAGVYKKNERTGATGWSKHTVALLWTGHELQLAKYGLAFAKEHLYNRPLAKTSKVDALERRRERYNMWRGMVEEMESLDMPNTQPSLIGDPEFHSAFRSLLLIKGVQKTTYDKWKRGEYPEHACTKNLLPKKTSWKEEHFEAIWEYFGMPESTWYSQWGWTEEPTNKRVFYNEDRIPQMLKEKQRKIDKPMPPYLMKKAKT